MFSSLTIRRLAIALIILSFVFSPEVSGAEITKRVVFSKGRTSVSYKGKLTRECASYDAYLLRAKKGQTITVKLTTTDRDPFFAIYETKVLGPEEDTILPNNEMLRRCTGKLRSPANTACRSMASARLTTAMLRVPLTQSRSRFDKKAVF